MGDDDPTSETGDSEETIVVPSHAALPAPPEITFTRPSLGRGTPASHHAANTPRAKSDGKSRESVDDRRLLAQGVQGYGIAITAAITLAVTIVIFVLIGQWLDRRYSHSGVPWFTIVGLLIGMVGGFANMIRLLNFSSGGSGRPKDGEKR